MKALADPSRAIIMGKEGSQSDREGLVCIPALDGVYKGRDKWMLKKP